MKKILIFLIPFIILIEIKLFSLITEFLREPSDIAVIVGVILMCADLALNFYLIKFYKKQLTQNKNKTTT